MDLSWGGQNWQLLSERALFWRERATLIFSDVHLGKAEDFQAAGRAVPSAVHDEDLRRIAGLLERLRPTRVLVLGDFVHSNLREHPHLAVELRRVRGLAPCWWTLALGNHDMRQPHRLQQWEFDEIVVDVREDGILLSHDGSAEGAGEFAFTVSGHVHPVVKLRSHRDRMRLPCFVVNPRHLLIPSFGTFTGGFEVTPSREDRIYVVTDHEVMAWS